MARQQFCLGEYIELRFLFIIERGEIVVADRDGGHLFREDHFVQPIQAVGKNIADFRRANLRPGSGCLRELETVSLQKQLRQKVAGSGLGVFEADNLAAQLIKAVDAAVFAGGDQAPVFRHAALPAPQ